MQAPNVHTHISVPVIQHIVWILGFMKTVAVLGVKNLNVYRNRTFGISTHYDTFE